MEGATPYAEDEEHRVRRGAKMKTHAVLKNSTITSMSESLRNKNHTK